MTQLQNLDHPVLIKVRIIDYMLIKLRVSSSSSLIAHQTLNFDFRFCLNFIFWFNCIAWTKTLHGKVK